MSATTSPSGAEHRDVDRSRPLADLGGAGSAPVAEGVSATRPPLRRSTDDKVLAGVAGGLGRYLGVDPVVIRIALVVFALSGGAGVLLYLIAWIAIPEEHPGEVTPGAQPVARATGAIVLGAILLLAGGILLVDRLLPGLSSFAGPLVLVALGVAVMLGARR